MDMFIVGFNELVNGWIEPKGLHKTFLERLLSGLIHGLNNVFLTYVLNVLLLLVVVY